MEREYTQKKMFIVQALTDLHCGTGQGVDDIDLPTAKEAATGFPLIPGSTIKGVMRDYFRKGQNVSKNKIFSVFGPDLQDEDAEAHASAIMITDGRLLFLPVRSFSGVFSYVTCPLILSRLTQDITQADMRNPPEVPMLEETAALVSPNTVNMADGHLILEELDLTADSNSQGWEKWCEYLCLNFFEADWGEKIAKPRLSLISDTVFSFLCVTSLPVNARIRLDDKTGVVAKGALWYEETVPSEAIFSGVIAATNTYGREKMPSTAVLDTFASTTITLQIGGKATTGKGLCRIRFWGKEDA